MKPSLEEYVTFLKSFLLSKGIMRQVKNNLANTTFSNDAIIQRNSLPIYTKALWLHNMAGEFFSFAFPWTKTKEKSDFWMKMDSAYQKEYKQWLLMKTVPMDNKDIQEI